MSGMHESAHRPVDAAQVTLRVLTPADAPTLLDLETRNRQHLLIGAPARGEAWLTETGQRTAIIQALAERDAGRSLPLGIWLEDGDESRLVGRLNLAGITRGAFESASLGYWVDHAVGGRGIATHAVRAAVALAFEGLRLHRLQAEVQVGNDASVRVLERSGFAEYGVAPAHLRLGGTWADCRLFQLVDAHWRPAETAPATASDHTVVGSEVPALEETVDLYGAVGWSVYTQDPVTLERSLAGSARVVTARRAGELVGLARVLSDGATIVYLQDVLVRPEAQRSGLGARLVEAVLEPYAEVRQQVLLTDAEPQQRAFYESLGFVEAHDHEAGLRSFVRLR